MYAVVIQVPELTPKCFLGIRMDMDPCFQAKDPEPQFSQLYNQHYNPVLPIFEIWFFVTVALMQGKVMLMCGERLGPWKAAFGFGLQMVEKTGCHGKTGERVEEPRLLLA